VKAFEIPTQPYMDCDEAVGKIRNVFCVGRNYRDHAVELGNDIPSAPLIFGKSTHALKAAHGTLELPPNRREIHHELEIVLYVDADYTPGVSFQNITGGVALGLDLTDRAAQSRLKEAGQPWEFAKGFPQSAVITTFYGVHNWDALLESTFTLELDNQVVQSGQAKQMMFDFQYIVDYIGQHFGLRSGDVIYTGTPAGVGPLMPGQAITMRMDNEMWGEMKVRTPVR